jgi:hypothetical protein
MTEPNSVNIQSKLATNRGAQGAADTEASLGSINHHPPVLAFLAAADLSAAATLDLSVQQPAVGECRR